MRKAKKTKPRCFPTWLLVALVTIAVFSPVVTYKFVTWDDNVNIYDNPNFNPVTFQNILGFWQKPFEHLYIPLTYTIWALQALVAYVPGRSGAEAFNPHVFHTFNLLLHVLSVLVVFILLKMLLASASSNIGRSPASKKGVKIQREMQPKGAEGSNFQHAELAAVLGALFFALHPMQVESVAWVTGMKDVLCGLLSLAAVWQYLIYVKISGEPGVGRKAFVHYALAVLFYILALLTKPSAVIVPFVALVFAWWEMGRSLRQTAYDLLPLVVIAVPWTIMTSIIQGSDHTAYITPIWKRPFIVGDTLSFYIYKLVVPISLGVDYGRRPEVVLEHWWAYVAWIVPVGLGILIWRLKERRLWSAAAVFVIGILPVSGVIPFAFQTYSTVADRYVYFSMLGPALALAWFASIRPTRNVKACSIILLVVLGTLTIFQSRYWANTSLLFQHAVEVNPQSSAAYYNLGLEYAEQDELEKAIQLFRKALEIKPDYDKAHNNLGVSLAGQGKLDEAAAHLTEAIKITPNYAKAHYNLGVVLEAQGREVEAAEHFKKAVMILPDYLDAYKALGKTLVRLGEMEEAVMYFSKAVRINPNDPDVQMGLGMSLGNIGRLDEAIEHLRKASELKPGDAEIHNNLAVALYIKGDYQGAWDQITLSRNCGGNPNPQFIAEVARKLKR